MKEQYSITEYIIYISLMNSMELSKHTHTHTERSLVYSSFYYKNDEN